MQNCGVRLLPLDFRDQYFGCEIELTGINRATAAQTLADLFGTRAEHSGGGYDAYRVKDLDGKEWKIVRDGSIHPECRRRSVLIGETYKVELNSPKLECPVGESWIVSNLNAALSTWNDKLAEIWSLLTESPQTFKGGQVWGVMTGIHGALQAIGYGLLVLFFAVGVMKTCGSFVEVKKPEHALKLFIRFALAKGAVTYGLELMLAVFSIVQGMVSTIITQSGSSGMSSVSLPQELIDAINNVGFWDSIPLWAVTLIGGLLITVLSFTMILTVYGRMFSLWMYAAIAPIPLSTFAGEPTSSVGKNFIRSYAGVCLQGVVIALSCIIFSAISSSPPAVDTGASVVTAVWTYVGELAFNLLVLVGAIKGCDRIVKEIMGL